jgi:hypothetical protein
MRKFCFSIAVQSSGVPRARIHKPLPDPCPSSMTLAPLCQYVSRLHINYRNTAAGAHWSASSLISHLAQRLLRTFDMFLFGSNARRMTSREGMQPSSGLARSFTSVDFSSTGRLGNLSFSVLLYCARSMQAYFPSRSDCNGVTMTQA